MSKGKIAIVGGGLAGLMAAIKIAERGTNVDLLDRKSTRLNSSHH